MTALWIAIGVLFFIILWLYIIVYNIYLVICKIIKDVPDFISKLFMRNK
jgi:hypothetical protein